MDFCAITGIGCVFLWTDIRREEKNGQRIDFCEEIIEEEIHCTLQLEVIIDTYDA